MVLRVNFNSILSSVNKMEKFNLGKVWSIMKIMWRICIILTIQIYTFPTYVLWMTVFLAPLRVLRPSWYWKIEGVVYKLIIRFVGAWIWLIGYEVQELGDELEPCYDERCLLLANHQSTADVPILMATFAHKESCVLSNTMWIISSIFRYTNFGVVSMIRGDFFITQGKNVRETQLTNLESHLKSSLVTTGKKWIVLFPEGGFLSNRRETSLRFARKNGHREMVNVTLPRMGCANQITETLKSETLKQEGLKDDPLKWIVDVTIAYDRDNGPLYFSSAYTYKPIAPSPTRVHYRRYPIESVPYEDKEKFQAWLFERWSEKEDMLEHYYKTGEFVARPNFPKFKEDGSLDSPNAIRYPLKKFTHLNVAILHLIFFIYSLFTWFILQSLWYYSEERLTGRTSFLLAVPEH